MLATLMIQKIGKKLSVLQEITVHQEHAIKSSAKKVNINQALARLDVILALLVATVCSKVQEAILMRPKLQEVLLQLNVH